MGEHEAKIAWDIDFLQRNLGKQPAPPGDFEINAHHVGRQTLAEHLAEVHPRRVDRKRSERIAPVEEDDEA